MNPVLKGALIALSAVVVVGLIGFAYLLSTITFAEEFCYDSEMSDFNPVLIGDTCIFGDSEGLYTYSITCDGSTVMWYSNQDIVDRDMSGLEDCTYEKVVNLENFK